MSNAVLQDALRLSVAERLELIDELWQSITADPAALPVTEAQKEELDRRLAEHRTDPEAGFGLDEVLDSLDE